MPPITQEQLVDALALGSAQEFFDIMNVAVDRKLQGTIEKAWVRLSVHILEESDDAEDFIRTMTAAQWSAFSAGWTIRGLADGKS